jgi:MtrB/PioB family decaheme-associated outer membrane protein
MKKLSVFVMILGIVFSLAAKQARADEKTNKDDAKVQGNAVSGVNFLKDERESSKFFEYRDVPRGFVLRSFDLSVEKGNSFFTFKGKNVRQADSRYDISAGSYGIFRADFTWDEIPHRFSYFGKTLYNEPQPGVYVLPDGLQTLLQNTVGDGAANTTLNMPAARALLKNFLTSAHGVDLGLDRHKGTLKLSFTPAVALSFNLDASRETREGTRPQGAALGSSNTIELPEPIQYTTTDLQASAEYAEKWGTVQAGYSASIFDNSIPTLTWDNPYRMTDQYGSSSAGNGPSVARMPLNPSNTAHKFYLNGAFKLLPSTRLAGSVSYGVFSQNEKLLPYTSNTALAAPVLGFPGALSPPRATAEAKANIASMDFTLTSRILKNVHLTAGYRYYDFANKTEALEMPDGSSVVDQTWSKTANPIEPYSYTRSKMFGELTFNILKNTALKVGYNFSSIERKGGFEAELTDLAGAGNKNKTDEKTFKISLDSNPLDWLLLRVSYLSAVRTWALDGKADIYASFYNFKRFFEASRDRKGLNFLVGLDLIKNLDIQVSYMSGKDSYPKSDYGLKSSDFTMVGVDLSYAIGPDTALYGYYSGEVYQGAQAARRPTSSDPRDDWWANTKDSVQSFGAGFNTVLKKNVLNLDISSIYSKAKGSADIGAGPGGSFAQINVLAYTKPLDMTEMFNLRAKLILKVTRNVSVAFGYWYERYKLDDIVRNDVQVDMIVPANIAGGPSATSTIFLGALEPGYTYHVGFLEFIWGW